MEPKKKSQLILIIIIIIGSVCTFLSGFWYYTSVQQDDIFYEDIPFQRGMSFTTWGSDSYNSSKAYDQVLEMKKSGIEWVGVNIWWIQKSVTSDEIYDGPWTDTAANITAFFEFIHDQDMKVFFKPMLDTEDNQWRSFIEASPKWIKEYNRFIKYCAEIAENASVEMLSMGCEMGNWQVHTEEVVNLIEDLRKIYSGIITYSANHDSFWYVEWWDKVDVIGLDAYFSFTLSYNPSLEDMIAVWDGFYHNLNKFQRRWNKPILFAELGCQNRDGCNIAPNDDKYRTDTDIDEFKMFYESLFLSKIWSAPWFKGTYWWMWDLHKVKEGDKDTDNGFSPQLVKDTIDEYYTKKREIIYPNYWPEFLMILVLGGLITIVSAYLFRRISVSRETNLGEEQPEDNKKSTENISKSNTVLQFVIIAGLSLGIFLFWAFTYYNQVLFNMLYGVLSRSFFLDEGVYVIIFALTFSLSLMILLWSILQRLVYKKEESRIYLIILIGLGCTVLIFLLETLFINYLTNEISLYYFLPFQIMILLGIFFTFIMSYGFPSQLYKNLENKEKMKTSFKIIFGIISVAALLILFLAYLLNEYTRGPSIVIAMILACLTLFIYNYSKCVPFNRSFKMEERGKTMRDRMRINKMKFIEAMVCLFALFYYFGVLRYYDSHTLINFNLILLSCFFIPIAISMFIALTLIIGLFLIIKQKNNVISDNIDFETNSKNEILLYLFKITIFFSLIILVLGWAFPQIEFFIILILGGIPLVLIFIIFFIGYINSQEIFKDSGSWKRLTIYLMFAFTIAFSGNGIMIGILYALTFVQVEDGKLVARTSFGEEFNYDAVQLIYNLQLLIAMISIIIIFLLLKFIAPRFKREY